LEVGGGRLLIEIDMDLWTIADAAHELEVEYRTLAFRIEKLEAKGKKLGARTKGGTHILFKKDIDKLRKHEPKVGRPRKIRE
jgi:hypothetical protein